jgi:G:T/U-mismatch repair DNA glycosylase
MALADEVLRHAHYAVCDAINVRRERLRNDRDPHATKIAKMRSNSAKSQLPLNELSMKVFISSCGSSRKAARKISPSERVAHWRG